jgi:hypothetical protein
LSKVEIIVMAAAQTRRFEMSRPEIEAMSDIVADGMEPHEMFYLARHELDAGNELVAKAIILAFLHVDAKQIAQYMSQPSEGVS